ncbi:MAG: DNA cytosine methyltransferase [Anaerolinea sp.]|nr:DNA cytosine methyltransferase [Anaerolinea sp.]
MDRMSVPDSLDIHDRNWAKTELGLLMPKHTWEALRKPKRRYPIAMDFFCGAGGFSLGTIQAGFEVIAAFDSSPEAALTYTVNLGNYPMKFHFATTKDEDRINQILENGLMQQKRKTKKLEVSGSGWRSAEMAKGNFYPGVSHFFLGDVRKWDPEEILEIVGLERGDVDLVMGGPPCQGFSRAGKQNVMDPRNSLVFDFARYVIGIYPKAMVFENVPEVASMITPEGINVIDAFVRILEDGDFAAYNALKKQLTTYKGELGVMRGKKRIDRSGDEEHEVEQNPERQVQLSMFG